MSDRRELDAYFTEPNLALALVRRLDDVYFFEKAKAPELIWEPHCGGGAFVKACKTVWPGSYLQAYDIADRFVEAAQAGADDFYRLDFLESRDPLTLSRQFLPDLIVGNPPYDNAEAHVRQALNCVRDGGMVAFLLRKSFEASAARTKPGAVCDPRAEGDPTSEGQKSMGLALTCNISPRPSFTDGGNDNSEYVLLVWVKGHTAGLKSGAPITWMPPERPRKVTTKEQRIEALEKSLAKLHEKVDVISAKIARLRGPRKQAES